MRLGLKATFSQHRFKFYQAHTKPVFKAVLVYGYDCGVQHMLVKLRVIKMSMNFPPSVTQEYIWKVFYSTSAISNNPLYKYVSTVLSIQHVVKLCSTSALSFHAAKVL